MAELHLDVISTASSAGLDEAQKELKETRGEADKLGKSFDDLEKEAFDLEGAIASSRAEVARLGAEFKTTGDRSLVIDLKREKAYLRDLSAMKAVVDEAEELAKPVEVATKKFFDLHRAIKASNDEVARLTAEFKKTGDQSLLGDLRREKSWLAELAKMAGGAGIAAGKGFSSAFEGVASKPALYGALVAGAALAAPAVGAIIAGAIGGTFVGAGMAGGIIAAANDSRVRSAWAEFSDRMSAEAFGAKSFVEPVVQGIHILRDAFQELEIGDTLAKAASSVPILAEGIAGLVTNLMPGLNDLMDDSAGFTTVFAEGLSETGRALSNFMTSISESEGTMEGLAYGFMFLNGFIVGTGNVLQALGDTFHWLAEQGSGVTGALEDMTAWLPVVGDSWAWMNDNLEKISAVGPKSAGAVRAVEQVLRDVVDPTEEVVDVLHELNEGFEKFISLQASLIGNQIDVAESIDNVTETLERNGVTLDINTEAGRENQRALLAAAKEARQLRDDQIEMGMSISDANAQLALNKEALYAQAEAAGLSRDEIEKLIGALYAVPTLPMPYSPIGTPPQHILDERQRAGGGPINAGEPYLVGEEGPEWVVPKRSGFVLPHGVTMGGDGASAGVQYVARPFVYQGTSRAASIVFEEVAEEVRRRGGELAVLNLKAPR
jgi:hypothetical protein